jgi:hypothetical protein
VATAAAAVATGAVLLAAWRWDVDAGRRHHVATLRAREVPREGRPGGYVSSAACAACHPQPHASWHASFHRTMTQYARPDTVRAPFEGVGPLRTKDGHLELARRGDEFWVTSVRGQGAAAARKEYRVGLLTGSHHMQIFWLGTGAGNGQLMMPYAFLLDEGRWVPARDTFLADPTIDWNFDLWNGECLQCHVTAGQPRPSGAGRAMDSRAAELGIACESCHGPGEAHVTANQSPWRRYVQSWRASKGQGDPTIINPARLDPRASLDVCGQCHGIHGIRDHADFLAEGFRYRPGEPLEASRALVVPGRADSAPLVKAFTQADPQWLESRFWKDGMVRVTGREWNAVVRSPCHARGPMTCLSCHSMHGYEDRDAQLAPGRRGPEACLGCHQDLRTKVEAHTHHAAGSPGSDCYNCHMPYTSYGLLKAVRSHEIDSPSARTAMATGRPTACNLCHLDRSLGWAADHLSAWYGQDPVSVDEADRTVAAAARLALRGDAGQRALVAWSMGWEPARRASGDEWLAVYLILALGDDYSAVRATAGRSLRTLPGYEDVAYDYVAPPEEIERATDAIIARWGRMRRSPLSPEKAARLLMRPDGNLLTDRVRREVAERDTRSMELRE